MKSWTQWICDSKQHISNVCTWLSLIYKTHIILYRNDICSYIYWGMIPLFIRPQKCWDCGMLLNSTEWIFAMRCMMAESFYICIRQGVHGTEISLHITTLLLRCILYIDSPSWKSVYIYWCNTLSIHHQFYALVWHCDRHNSPSCWYIPCCTENANFGNHGQVFFVSIPAYLQYLSMASTSYNVDGNFGNSSGVP